MNQGLIRIGCQEVIQEEGVPKLFGIYRIVLYLMKGILFKNCEYGVLDFK